MKRLIVILSSCLGVVALSHAQAAGPSGPSPYLRQNAAPNAGMGRRLVEMRAEILAKLDLSDEQKTELKAHDKAMAEKRRAMLGADPKSSDARSNALALQRDNEAFLKGLLSPEQYRRFVALRREALAKLRDEPQKPARPSA